MKSGPFALIVAFATKLEIEPVKAFARKLKEAGLMQTGARGVNAPEVSPSDMSTLLLALLASDKQVRAAEVTARIKGFQLSSPQMIDAVGSLLPDPDHTLFDFMTLLCSPSFYLPDGLDITIRAVGQAFVEVEGDSLDGDPWKIVYWPREEMQQSVVDHVQLRDDPASARPGAKSAEFEGPLSLHGIVTSREIGFGAIEFIKSMAFEEVVE